MFRGRWTDAIHEEWTRNVLADKPDLSEARLQKTRERMTKAVRDCLITDYEDLIPALTLPDPDDRHVLAAAIQGRVDVIVTFNLKDFPAPYLQKYGIEVQHPDVFVLHLLHLYCEEVCDAVKQQRENCLPPLKSRD